MLTPKDCIIGPNGHLHIVNPGDPIRQRPDVREPTEDEFYRIFPALAPTQHLDLDSFLEADEKLSEPTEDTVVVREDDEFGKPKPARRRRVVRVHANSSGV